MKNMQCVYFYKLGCHFGKVVLFDPNLLDLKGRGAVVRGFEPRQHLLPAASCITKKIVINTQKAQIGAKCSVASDDNS